MTQACPGQAEPLSIIPRLAFLDIPLNIHIYSNEAAAYDYCAVSEAMQTQCGFRALTLARNVPLLLKESWTLVPNSKARPTSLRLHSQTQTGETSARFLRNILLKFLLTSSLMILIWFMTLLISYIMIDSLGFILWA